MGSAGPASSQSTKYLVMDCLASADAALSLVKTLFNRSHNGFSAHHLQQAQGKVTRPEAQILPSLNRTMVILGLRELVSCQGLHPINFPRCGCLVGLFM